VGLEARHAWDKYREAPSRRKSAVGPPPSRLHPECGVRSAQRALRLSEDPAGLGPQ
jgi:hypothetical protein